MNSHEKIIIVPNTPTSKDLKCTAKITTITAHITSTIPSVLMTEDKSLWIFSFTHITPLFDYNLLSIIIQINFSFIF